MALKQEDEALANGARGTEDTWSWPRLSAIGLFHTSGGNAGQGEETRARNGEDDEPHFFSGNLVAMVSVFVGTRRKRLESSRK